jgi:hypothetical protein
MDETHSAQSGDSQRLRALIASFKLSLADTAQLQFLALRDGSLQTDAGEAVEVGIIAEAG